jgi:hypothetical protein
VIDRTVFEYPRSPYLRLLGHLGCERAVFENGPSADALLFSTLGMNAPKIALNVELGDSANLEARDCGCVLGSMGLRTHISEIRSFEKLSTEGTTFWRGNVPRILETTLPARFGGSAIDYQVVEEEAVDGAAHLVLRIRPAVGAVVEATVRATLLQELARGGVVDEYQAALIGRAESIVIRRLPPLHTRVGKVLPFQIDRPASRV